MRKFEPINSKDRRFEKKEKWRLIATWAISTVVVIGALVYLLR